MLNTRMTKEREVPLWAIGAPTIGVPLMVALLSLTAPEHETPVDGADLGATTEQVERQAVDLPTKQSRLFTKAAVRARVRGADQHPC